ncbi:Crp/Fnr family transcriptional regulator [Epilithonimonas zeae]|uniref:cAMP-binding domain of CRP or a regulatory subunit of cAMP-dependent protein kinases n=1 Tax=Epilithonimonas zeae TaxID=1416779 RepID=A0A1N6FUS2_9FLAO|nr:Crp/Fnr family transcriptional regulator [Epilithonimonas zeae]SIN99034.1 cAMP-binding domain of CRP or a regulatory subunit of cAMP-dependent protein kinases [Epilithonimonas zeae]
MVIKQCILESVGAFTQNYDSAEPIFLENDVPKFYFQIIEGKVKLNNYNAEGKEVLHNILENGQSVGESSLFLDGTYPVNAIALTSSKVLKLPRSAFIDLLLTNPEISMEINKRISSFLHFKHVMGQIICTHNPMAKIKALLDYLKSIHKDKEPFSFQVPFTRQEMANLTGLCVETTIRTVKTMEMNNIVKIRNRKILY